MKSIKKIFHLYAESNNKNVSEFWYFQVLDREFDNVSFVYYNNEQSFIKEANKKKKKSDEFFIAIMDSDIDYNNVAVSVAARTKTITRLAKSSPNIDICLSSRCWENWLVKHFQIFNQHTINNTNIPIPDYSKKRSWYTKHQKVLLSTLADAVARCKKQREILFSNNGISFAVDELPDFSQQSTCTFLINNCNPLSYMDLIIEKIEKENN